MDKISSHEVNGSIIERYSFYETFKGFTADPGLILAYALYTYERDDYVIAALEMREVRDEYYKIYQGRSDESLFESVTDFFYVWNDGKFDKFILEAVYKGCHVIITGQSGSRELVVSYPKYEKTAISDIFMAIEWPMNRLLVTIEPAKDRYTKRGFNYKSGLQKALQKYEDTDEDGRLARIPCAVGTLCYKVEGAEVKPTRMLRLSQIALAMENGEFDSTLFLDEDKALAKAARNAKKNVV